MAWSRLALLGAVGVFALGSGANVASSASAETSPDAPRRVAQLTSDYPGLYPGTDPSANGRARLTLSAAERTVCFRVRVSGMTTRGVYVYRRSDNALVTRLYDEAPTDADLIIGCAREVPASVLQSYKKQPGRYYVKAFSYDGLDEIAGVLRTPR